MYFKSHMLNKLQIVDYNSVVLHNKLTEIFVRNKNVFLYLIYPYR